MTQMSYLTILEERSVKETSFTGAKAKVLAGLWAVWRLQARIHLLAFPASRSCPRCRFHFQHQHLQTSSLHCLPLLLLPSVSLSVTSASTITSPSLSLTLLAPSFKDPMKTQKTKIWLLEGEGKVAEFGKVMYTLLCLKWTTNKDLLSSTGNSAQCYAAAFMGGGFEGRMYGCVLSPFTRNYHIVNRLYPDSK